MDTVLLATDGSDYARPAACRAVDLAAERGATLQVICVVDERRFGHPALSSSELASIYAADRARTCVEEVTEMAADRAVHVEGDVRHGVPHETVVEYADDVGADVIVVGKHGEQGELFAGFGRRIREASDRTLRIVHPGIRST